MASQEDFLTLNALMSSSDVDWPRRFSTLQNRRALKRWWKRLSRLQRSLIMMLTVTGFLFALYCLPGMWSVVWPSSSLHYYSYDFTEQYTQKQEQIATPKQQSSAIPLEFEILNRLQHLTTVKYKPRTANKDYKVLLTGPTNDRQKAVVDAFLHAWKGYRRFAWGHDHLKPISRTHHTWFGLGLTLIDSLDTLLIMGLHKEFGDARHWVANYLDFNINRDVNLFETTIRVLGGLLGAYHLSGDKMFLERAVDLGDRLLPCFNTPSGVPTSDINLATRHAHSPRWSLDSSTSEVTTLQLEFRDLSLSANNSKYNTVAFRVTEHVHGLSKNDGLVPIFINSDTGQFRPYSVITFGARGDSYYEYLLKQWLQTGKTLDFLRHDYEEAMNGMMKHLARRTYPNRLLFIGELLGGSKEIKPKMDHLTCYLPGTMALGVHNGLPKEHLKFAEDLLYTCYQTYALQPTFLAPEITYFHTEAHSATDTFVKPNDAHNLLRPETLESLWYMYHLTGNKTYQDWGWNIFQAFEKYTRVPHGYTSIGRVKSVSDTKPRDMMESYFLGETLKYLYLLFSDDQKTINLDDFVFNSEAHLLPIYER